VAEITCFLVCRIKHEPLRAFRTRNDGAAIGPQQLLPPLTVAMQEEPVGEPVASDVLLRDVVPAAMLNGDTCLPAAASNRTST
jgi:hypothetical protein